MAENTAGVPKGRLIAVVAVATVVILATIFTVIQHSGGATPAGDSAATPTPTAPASTPATQADQQSAESEDDVDGSISGGMKVLPEPMNGQAAIDALGDKIESVAKRNGKTVDELKDLLLRDETAYVSTTGFIGFRDDFGDGG